ncbi:MAG: translation initiation factor eIF-1A [Candidatus Aenigmarchaeota archaeon]|nr:translation initiation factor eIF-1A [Candidatus Aenigmarchaeota archaeon]
MEEVQRVRIPKGREVLGIVEARLGGNKLRVRCQDNKTRICRIPGRFKRHLWIGVNDVIIVEPWEIHGDERGDAIWKYSKVQENWLRKNNILKL